MVKNIILDVGKVLVAWEPEDAMKKLGFDDKTVKVVADATVNTPVWLETDRGVWSDEQILQAFYEKAPEYKKEIDLFWNHLELAITQFSYTKEWISNMKKEGLHVYILSNYGDWTYQRTKDNALDFLSTCYLDIYIVFLQILFHLPDRLKADSVDSGFFGSLDIFHPVIDKYTLIRCELIFF